MMRTSILSATIATTLLVNGTVIAKENLVSLSETERLSLPYSQTISQQEQASYKRTALREATYFSSSLDYLECFFDYNRCISYCENDSSCEDMCERELDYCLSSQ
jgi:hypothetical protein